MQTGRKEQGITSLMMSEESRALERGEAADPKSSRQPTWPPESDPDSSVSWASAALAVPIPIISVPVASLDHRTPRTIIEHAGQTLLGASFLRVCVAVSGELSRVLDRVPITCDAVRRAEPPPLAPRARQNARRPHDVP